MGHDVSTKSFYGRFPFIKGISHIKDNFVITSLLKFSRLIHTLLRTSQIFFLTNKGETEKMNLGLLEDPGQKFLDVEIKGGSR